MIQLHRLGHAAEPIVLNPDLIVWVEAHPDTVITLSTGAKVNVVESPEEVTARVLAWKREIVARTPELKPATVHPIS